jgi:hypothetical protein
MRRCLQQFFELVFSLAFLDRSAPPMSCERRTPAAILVDLPAPAEARLIPCGQTCHKRLQHFAAGWNQPCIRKAQQEIASPRMHSVRLPQSLARFLHSPQWQQNQRPAKEELRLVGICLATDIQIGQGGGEVICHSLVNRLIGTLVGACVAQQPLYLGVRVGAVVHTRAFENAGGGLADRLAKDCETAAPTPAPIQGTTRPTAK